MKLQSERKEITLDPKVLGRYVGAYRWARAGNMLVTLENNQLISKLGNQPVDPDLSGIGDDVLPQSGGRPARVSQGRRQGQGEPDDAPPERPAIDGEADGRCRGQTIADAAAAAAKRFKDQKASARAAKPRCAR